MKANLKKWRPNALLGFLKAFGMVFVLLFMLPVWLIRGARSRARFRAELRASGVPAEAAKRLSGRLKIHLRDLRGFNPASD
jgi:hypothetical protein